MADIEQLKSECLELRNDIIDMIYKARSGHSGGSLSSVEILWTLYSEIMNVSPKNPKKDERDRFVLSKGHAAPALYAVLAKKGFFPKSELDTLRKTGSKLQGHPDMNKVPGVDMSSGSLGMGISAGIGMGLAARLAKLKYKTYVLVGDGELNEGQNWEALMAAYKFRLRDLIVIADVNGVQLDGTTEEIMPLINVAEKFASFGCDVYECDGHDPASILDALEKAKSNEAKSDKPKAVVAKTVKGKGVSFMEGKNAWHGKQISDEDYAKAKEDLKGA